MEFEEKAEKLHKVMNKVFGQVVEVAKTKPVGALEGAKLIIEIMDRYIGGSFINRFFPSHLKMSNAIAKEKDSLKKKALIDTFLSGKIEAGKSVACGLKQALDSYFELLPYEGLLQHPFNAVEEDMDYEFKVEE